MDIDTDEDDDIEDWAGPTSDADDGPSDEDVSDQDAPDAEGRKAGKRVEQPGKRKQGMLLLSMLQVCGLLPMRCQSSLWE